MPSVVARVLLQLAQALCRSDAESDSSGWESYLDGNPFHVPAEFGPFFPVELDQWPLSIAIPLLRECLILDLHRRPRWARAVPPEDRMMLYGLWTYQVPEFVYPTDLRVSGASLWTGQSIDLSYNWNRRRREAFIHLNVHTVVLPLGQVMTTCG